MKQNQLTLNSCRNYIKEQLFEPNKLVHQYDRIEKVGLIGVEMEVFPYTRNKNKNLTPVPLYDGKRPLIDTLVSVSKAYGGVAKFWNQIDSFNDHTPGINKIEFPNGDCFHFEPGGQVEIITAPCKSIVELQERLEDKQNLLKKVTQESQIHFGQIGTNPLHGVHRIGNQLQKPRYCALEEYFNSIGSYGKQMMLQTCSMHINFDLGFEESLQVKRIVLSNLLIPFATALFANSSRIEGKASGHSAYRSFIWQHLDRSRTGILPMDKVLKTMKKDDLIDTYVDFALQAPLIHIPELGNRVLSSNYTMDYWIKNPIKSVWPNKSNLKNHLSLLFPEVRPKGFIEIRSIDAPPPEWQMVPVYFYSGLLYSDNHLNKALDLLSPLGANINELFQKSTHGLASDDIFKVSKKLMKLAINGLSDLPDKFKDKNSLHQMNVFFERFTMQRKSFADEPSDKFIF